MLHQISENYSATEMNGYIEAWETIYFKLS